MFFFSNAFDNRLAVCILRVTEGLDYARIMDEEENTGCYSSQDLTLVGNSQQATHNGFLTSPKSSGLGNGMMHADSNLSLSRIGVADSAMSTSMPTLSSKFCPEIKKTMVTRSRCFLNLRLYGDFIVCQKI